MRNHRFCFIGIIFLALGCLIFDGCTGPVQELERAGNTGIVRVTAGNGDRTLMPSLPSVSSYRFSFISLEKLPEDPVVKDSTNSSLEIELSAGSWNLTVTALTGAGSNAKEIARGSATLLVLRGVTNSVTVQLGNEPGGETGSLSYTVSFPDTVNQTSLTLTSMGGGEDSAPVNLLEGYAQSGGIITKTGVLNAAAGNYLLNVDLYGPTLGHAGKTEVVHIYSNTETAMGAGYAFTAGDFTPTRPYQTVSSMSLLTVLTAIGSDTSGSMDFTVSLGQHESLAPFSLTTASFNGKKIRIRGNGYRVTLNGTGSLFTVGTGVALVLQDIELQGRDDNTGALITITGGNLLMNPETVITGNSGGGISIQNNGAFTMNGGTISGNSYSYGGGGVFLQDGTFTMSGGTISGNSASNLGGGGICVMYGIFTMNGGTIAENSVSQGSGAVSIWYGTFTMRGGTILKNTSLYDSAVSAELNGTFTMSGGTIAENSNGGVEVSGGTFTMSGGTIVGNSASYSGGAIFVGRNGSDIGAFTMNGGSISGNSTNSAIDSNFSSQVGEGGGGVAVGMGTFTMNGGSISGNVANNNTSFSQYGGGGVAVGTISIGQTGGTFIMNGGTITGNASFFTTPTTGNTYSSYGGGVYVVNGTFAMNNNTRVDASNEVCLGYYYDYDISDYRYAALTLAGNFSDSDTIAVIDLHGALSDHGVATDWLGQSVLARDTGYTGTIPVSRFTLRNFVGNDNFGFRRTPITNYVINSEGKLANK